MLDAFAVMGLPRHPWVDASELKDKFRQAAAKLHPDSPAGDTASFHDLNEAFAILRNPAKRLRLLVALEFPEFNGKATFVPDADLFAKVHSVLDQKNLAGIHQMETALSQRLAALEAGLRTLPADAQSWLNAATESIFLQKWSDQLREKSFQLSNR